MATGTTARDHYLQAFGDFETRLNGQSDSPFHRIRKQAIQVFGDLDFPTTRDEAWTHTSVAELAGTEFIGSLPDQSSVSPESLSPYTFEANGFGGSRLTFVNGSCSKDLSTVTPLPDGVTVTSLRQALAGGDERLLEHLGRVAPVQDQAFAALNTAFVDDGAFVYIPRNTDLLAPVLLLFLSTDASQPQVTYPRVLVVAEEGARATVVEACCGPDRGASFTNAVTEVVAGDNAFIDHYKLDMEGREAYHIALTQTRQGRKSNVSTLTLSLGGRLIRNDVNALLSGEGCEATANGLYLTEGQQHIDNHTLIEHAEPNCSSHELYKGLLGGRSTGVFRGKIHVHQKAQMTDAYQANQNLLLSDEAEINSKPQLEIYADDVKCSHGATIGQLDQDALFYLRARGVGLELAQQMLVRSFAGDILERIKVDPVREAMTDRVMAKFERATTAEKN